MTCTPCTCSPAQAVACSQTSSSATTPSAPSNGNPTVARSCASEPQTDGFPTCTCTRATFGCSIHPNTRDEWIASMQASLVRTLASLERELVSAKAPEAGFTAKSCALLAQYDRATCSWKTSQPSFLCLEPSSVTWPRWGMTVDGCAYEHPQSARRIIGTGGGVWQTPVADDAVDRSLGKINSRGEPKLSAQVKMWPTPTAHCAKDCSSPSELTRNTPNLAALVGGVLNPTWVEWLMGWPLGFTASRHWATAKSRSKPQPLGDCSEGLE